MLCTSLTSPVVYSLPSAQESLFFLDGDNATTWQNSGRTVPGGDGAMTLVWDNDGTDSANAVATGVGIVFLDPDPDTGMSCAEISASANNITARSYTGSISMSAVDTFTMGMLVLVNTWATGSGDTVVSLRNGGNIVFEWHTPSTITCRVGNSTNTSAGSSILNSWTTLIVTADGTTVKAYVNGVLLGSVASSGPYTADSLIIPMTSSQAGEKFNYLWLEARHRSDTDVWLYHSLLIRRTVVVSAESTSPTALSPTDLNAAYWFDSTASGVLRNGASEASNGGSITSWQPTTGSLTLSQPAGLDAPTRQTHLSTTVVQYQATGTPALSVNLAASATRTVFTAHFVLRYTQFTANLPFLSLGTDRGSPRMMLDQSAQQLWFEAMTSLSSQCGQNMIADSHWHLFSIIFNGDRKIVRCFIDGAECSPGVNNTVVPSGAQSSASSFSQGGIGLGYAGGSTGIGGFQIASLSIHLEEHTPAQVRQLLKWARTVKYTSLFSGWNTDPVVFWFGSSNLLIGSGSTDHSIPRLCLTATSDYSRVYVLATGGTNTEHGIHRVMRQFYRLGLNRTGKNVCSLYFGGNDYRSGFSVATLQSLKMRYKNWLITNDADVVVEGTQLPGTDVSNTDRATVNTYLGTQTSSTYKLAALAANALIGEDGDNLNTTYYIDGTHLTDTGTEIAAGIYGAVIDGEIP